MNLQQVTYNLSLSTDVHSKSSTKSSMTIPYHRENGGTLGMVPLIINPIYTRYIVGIYWVYPLLKGSLRG